MSRSNETEYSISLIALIMFLVTVLGFVGLGIVLKMSGYPDDQFVRWTPIAVTLRERGRWVLAVPFLWALFAVISSRIDRGILSDKLAGAIGVFLIAVILVLFLYAVMNPFTRPFLIGIRPKARPENQLNLSYPADRAPR